MESKDLKWSKLIPLNEQEVNKLNEKLAGVFRISEKNKIDGQFYVVFVSSSLNMKADLTKIISHDYSDRPLMSYLRNGNEFAFRYVGGIVEEDLRKAIEKQMYKHYAPMFNKEEPVSPLDVQVNLS